MTLREPPTIADGWDAHASDYTRLFSPLTGHIARSMVAIVADRLPPHPHILDIACGPGDLSVAAAQLCAERGGGSVLATDLSPVMVETTAQALSAIAADTHCDVRNGQALDLDDAGFDVAFSCFGIFLFPDRLAAWRSAASALRPGGFLVTSAWRGPEFNELASVQMGPFMSALPSRLTEPKPRASWADLSTAEGLISEVTETALFRDAEIHVVDATLVVPSASAMWRGLEGNPITGALISRCTSDEKEVAKKSVIAAFQERTGGSNLPFLLKASCHVLVARRIE